MGKKVAIRGDLTEQTPPRPGRARRLPRSRSDASRALAIAALGAIAFLYLRGQGVSDLRSFSVVAAGCTALAVLWALEWRTGFGEAGSPNPRRSDFDWGMHYLRGFAIVMILLTHFFGCIGPKWVKPAFFSGSTVYFLFISGYLCQSRL